MSEAFMHIWRAVSARKLVAAQAWFGRSSAEANSNDLLRERVVLNPDTASLRGIDRVVEHV